MSTALAEPIAEESSRRPHFVRRVGLLVLGLVVAAWLIVAGRAIVVARHHLTAGMAAVGQARRQVSATELAAGAPLAHLRVASAEFAAGYRQLTSPALFGVRFFPVIGRQLQSLQALSSAASKVSTVALSSAGDARTILDGHEQGLVNEGRTAQKLASLLQRSQQQLATVSLGPRNGLIPTLAHARNTVAADLEQLRSALARGAVGASSLSAFLTGSHRYLVVAANNAEMRAGSGMFLSLGVLVVDPSGVHLEAMQSVTTVAVPSPGMVPLSGDLAARWGWLAPNQEWRNLMLSPQFDVQAPLAAQMWVAIGHQPVDGVLSLDSVAMQDLLQATGPIAVNGHQIDATNVVHELLNGQYHEFLSDTTNQEGPRRDELALIAQVTFGVLTRGGWSRTALAEGLADSARGRHIMLWSRDPAQQAGWQALGVDGSVGPSSLLISVLNRGANKLDYFLHVQSRISFAAQGRDTAVTLAITLDNQVPAGEPTEVSGPNGGTGVAPGTYVGLLSVTMPATATDGHFDGVSELAVSGRDGPTEVMAFAFQLSAGGQRSVVAHYVVPGRTGTVRVEPSARVPAVLWTSSGQGSWSDVVSRTVSWRNPSGA